MTIQLPMQNTGTLKKTFREVLLKLNSVDYQGVHFHSAKIQAGDLFVAIPGTNTDGHDYIHEAINRGAIAVIGEKKIQELPVPYIRVDNARYTLAQLACRYYQHPAQKHRMVGITGTNGKTTTAYMLRHILEQCGSRSALIGSVAHIINGSSMPSTHTTPDALQLQQMLHDSKDPFVVMEVSSHGIDQERVSGTEFDVAVFTNLSHDHLDYHGDLLTYFNVKARLFHMLKANGVCVINDDHSWGRHLIAQLRSRNQYLRSYGSGPDNHTRNQCITDASHSWGVRAQIVEQSSLFQKHSYELCLFLPGRHNLFNALAAFTTARSLGIEGEDIINALRTFPGVPGRLEKITSADGRIFLIDYAHTPDGLHHCLHTIKQYGTRRIIHVFGFRGNRDPYKRSKMLSIADQYSSKIFLTLDDLNQVKQEEMVAQLEELATVYGKEKCTIIEDRTLAIKHAAEQAQPGDWVAITGKGAESYEQTFTLPCTTDRETVQYLADSPCL